jgi:hypothetical protein
VKKGRTGSDFLFPALVFETPVVTGRTEPEIEDYEYGDIG